MPQQPSKPDLSFLRIGARVVLRHRMAGADPGSPTLTDTVGEVVALSPDRAELRTRTGVVEVSLAQVVAAREAPPAPARRHRRHSAIAISDLQRIMVDAVPPLETAQLGSWLLRAANGFTGRANSALALGDPGAELADALDQVGAWYDDRGLTPMLQLAVPRLEHLASDPIANVAVDRGWRPQTPTLVMTATARQVAATDGPAPARIVTGPAETDDWWAVSSDRTQRNRVTAEAIHRRVLRGSYLVAYRDQQAVGHARIALGGDWSGICDVHVDPRFRGTGIGRSLIVAAATRTHADGIRNLYLQVAQDNSPAIGLYRSLGFDVHHEYVYLART